MIEVQCPYCKALLRDQEAASAVCFNCGRWLGPIGMMEGTQAVQFDNPPLMQHPAAQQYAQPPYAQPPYAPMQQPGPMAVQHTPEELALAKKKRNGWRLMNAAMLAIQTVVLALGILWDDKGYGIGTAMVMGWLASVFVFAIVSAVARPDEAYIEKKPAVGRAIQCLLQLLFGIGTLLSGAILWGILSELM